MTTQTEPPGMYRPVRVQLVHLLAPLCLLVAFVLSAFSLNDRLPTKDAAEYTRLAHFWLSESMFSNGDRDETGAFQPSMIREPGLPALYAVAMWAAGVEAHALDCSAYTPSSELIRSEWGADTATCGLALQATRWANVLSLVAMGALAFYGTTLVLPGAWYRLLFLCTVVFGAYFSIKLNSNYSEILAAFLVLATSLALHGAVFARKLRWPLALVGGVCLAALILTKSVFYYAGPMIALFAILRAVRKRSGSDLASILLLCLVGYAGAFLWIERNKTEFGLASITDDRNVLAVRVEYNAMTFGEWLSGWARYTPFVRQNSVGSLGPGDTSSRMSRTNPDGYYQRGVLQTGRAAEATGKANPTEKEIRSAAFMLIRTEPLSHLFTTPLFAYRGIFVDFRQGYQVIRDLSWTAGYIQGLVSSLIAWIAIMLSIFFFMRGLLRDDFHILMILLLPAYSYIIHSSATHYIPRYTEPSIPCFLLVLVLLLFRASSARSDAHHTLET